MLACQEANTSGQALGPQEFAVLKIGLVHSVGMVLFQVI